MTDSFDPKLERARLTISAQMKGLNADILEMDNIDQIQELSRHLKSVSRKLRQSNFQIRVRLYSIIALTFIGLTVLSVVINEGFRSVFGESLMFIGLIAAAAPWYFCMTNRKVGLHLRELVSEKDELTHELSNCKGNLQLAQIRKKEVRATL